MKEDVLETANLKEIKAVKNLSGQVPTIDRTDIKTQSVAPPQQVAISDDDHSRPEITGSNRSMKPANNNNNNNNNRITRAHSDRSADPNMDPRQPREGNNNPAGLALGNSDAIDNNGLRSSDDRDRKNDTDFENNRRRQRNKKGIIADSYNSKNYENSNVSTASPGREFGRDGKIEKYGEQEVQNNPAVNSTVPGQGSGAAVVRALRDIATQKKLMQEHLVELEK